MKKFWSFVNSEKGKAELLLYGAIKSEKSWWDEESIYPKQFKKDLDALGDVTEITVRINSGGGDVFAAIAIYTQLKSHAANVIAINDGIMASAATIPAMAADIIKGPSASVTMIHDPLSLMIGYYNAKDLEKMAERLDAVKSAIISAYMSKTGKSREDLAEMMEKEKWMTAQEAKEHGFLDEIMFEEQIEASMTNDNRFIVVNSIAHDLSGFQARPMLNQSNRVPPKPVVKPTSIISMKESDSDVKNLAELKEKYPEIYNQVVAETQSTAQTEAQKAERDRLKAIDEISASIDPVLVAKAKYEEPITAEQLAFQAMKQNALLGKQHLDNRSQELQNSSDVGGELNAGLAAKEAAEAAAAIDTIANGINKKRGGKQ